MDLSLWPQIYTYKCDFFIGPLGLYVCFSVQSTELYSCLSLVGFLVSLTLVLSHRTLILPHNHWTQTDNSSSDQDLLKILACIKFAEGVFS